jgi:hypothetical protein
MSEFPVYRTVQTDLRFGIFAVLLVVLTVAESQEASKYIMSIWANMLHMH